MGGAVRFIALLTSPFPPVLHRPTSIIFHRLVVRRISTATTRQISLSSPPTDSRRSYTLLLAGVNSFRKELHAQPFNSDWETASSPHKPSPIIHPWPEWSRLLDTLLYSQWNQSAGTRGNGISSEDSFVVYEEKELSDEFIYHASVCLAFSRSRPELLNLSFLSRKDMEVIASNGTPFLFKSALDIARRLRGYLGLEGGKGQVLEPNNATFVDVMKYIISYASSPSASSERNGLYSRELAESSVRNLLHQMTEACFGDPAQKIPASEQHQFNGAYEQSPRPLRQNVEMKRGDWICPKCSFMNFARNFTCLECEEPRPKKLLTGGEWQCPQCNFYNYGRNLVCLRCDCKRPGAALANNVRAVPELGSIHSDLSDADVDEKFPEITPLSERENRLLVIARKSSNKVDGSSINRSLDQVLGHSSPTLRTADPTMQVNDLTDTSTSFPGSSPEESQQLQDINPRSVPLSRGMFSAQDISRTNVGKKLESDGYDMTSRTSPQVSDVLRKSESDSQNKDNNQAEKSEKWFQRVAELHNVKDLPSAISDEEFPEIMPMRKGENRYVVSRKKDRSLTSPAYKRHAATGQAVDSNFVPFVPFPPGYFSKKDTPVSVEENSSAKSSIQTSPSSMITESFPKDLDDGRPRDAENSTIHRMKNHVKSSGDLSSNFSVSQGVNLGGNTSQSSISSHTIGSEIRRSGHSREENAPQSINFAEATVQLPDQNASSGWTGKSLEGSAVKEPDHLDMSEEAKAERWFRRVAQIKDISELSQIPDEDFPSIMPMRKGVNRFVVSKRKTPLERRLTSQYRRNLPTVSSDPMKKDNDGK